jgi:CRP/FNR family cyclic AMP-dependent transcriptional regulator
MRKAILVIAHFLNMCVQSHAQKQKPKDCLFKKTVFRSPLWVDGGSVFHNTRFMAIHTSLLQQFSLLRHLPATTLQQLADSSVLRSFARREVVLGKETPVEFLFFLLEGRLQATDFTLDGKEVGLYFVEEGQYFGEIAMLDGLAYPEIMIANKKSQVVQVPNRLVRGLILEHPKMTEDVTIGLAQRVREQSEQRQILSINNPLQRVCAQLLLLLRHAPGGNSAAPGQNEQRELPGAPTHQELAMMVNLSRETVTRVFQVLQSRGALDRQSEALSVDVQRVMALAQNAD